LKKSDLFVRALEICCKTNLWRDFLTHFAASANRYYSTMSKSPNQWSNFTKNNKDMRCSNRFSRGSSNTSALILLPLYRTLCITKVPGKLY